MYISTVLAREREKKRYGSCAKTIKTNEHPHKEMQHNHICEATALKTYTLIADRFREIVIDNKKRKKASRMRVI